MLAAAAVWAARVPWPTNLIIAIGALGIGLLGRQLQIRRARRDLPPGYSITFRANGAEIDDLPFDRSPLMMVTRECVVTPTPTGLMLGAVADGSRRLVCQLPYAAWSTLIEVDPRGRAQRIRIENADKVIVDRLARGRVPPRALEIGAWGEAGGHSG